MKVKIFTNGDVQQLEDDINSWLRTAGNIEIVEIKQFVQGCSMSLPAIISIFYEEQNDYNNNKLRTYKPV